MKLNMELVKEALIAVQEKALKGETESAMGICTHLDEEIKAILLEKGYSTDGIVSIQIKAEDWLGQIFPTWKHYSGSLAYPVPSGEKLGPKDDPIQSAYKAYDQHLWDLKTKYGKLRMKLLKFLIEQAGKSE